MSINIATGKTIPGLTNPYPTPKTASAASKKKSRHRSRKKKRNEKNETKRNVECDNIATATDINSTSNMVLVDDGVMLNFLEPNDLISQLRLQLNKAKEEKDHCTANVIRQRIWLLQDAAAGVNSKISEEEMQAVLTQTNNLKIFDNGKSSTGLHD